jgi:glyoxylase-like metal-dependent hydrolase (beta-lactamase superfamily II)
MAAYMASLEKLLARDDLLYYPTHGAPITNPGTFVRQLIAHRREREDQVLACIAAGSDSIDAMVQKLYVDVDPRLHRAAGRSVLAHLEKLIGEARVARACGDAGDAASAPGGERFVLT